MIQNDKNDTNGENKEINIKNSILRNDLNENLHFLRP